MGGDHFIVIILSVLQISIHSARVGGDRKTRFSPANSRISIHSARVGGDLRGADLHRANLCISIHSARVGGDLHIRGFVDFLRIFQSTPPVWAETAKETIFSSLKHLYYNIFYRKKQENSM